MAGKRTAPRGAQRIADAPLESDVWIYRGVALALGIVAGLAVLGAILLAIATSRDTPQILIALGSASIGALAGLLAPTPRA